jgi:hypothetical protein
MFAKQNGRLFQNGAFGTQKFIKNIFHEKLYFFHRKLVEITENNKT